MKYRSGSRRFKMAMRHHGVQVGRVSTARMKHKRKDMAPVMNAALASLFLPFLGGGR